MHRLMKHVAMAALLAAPWITSAAAPGSVGFSARVADSGSAVTGNHDFTFALWDCDGTVPASCVAGTNLLWEEAQTLEVKDGVVATSLGANAGNLLPASAFVGGSLWLEVSMDGVAFNPRISIHAVPYALRAAIAEDLACSACVSDAEIAGISGSKVTGSVATATTATTATSASSVPWSGVTGRPTTLTCATVTASVDLGPGGWGYPAATCPAGTVLTGGGGGGGGDMRVTWSYPSGQVWLVNGYNASASAYTLRAYAVCCSF